MTITFEELFKDKKIDTKLGTMYLSGRMFTSKRGQFMLKDEDKKDIWLFELKRKTIPSIEEIVNKLESMNDIQELSDLGIGIVSIQFGSTPEECYANNCKWAKYYYYGDYEKDYPFELMKNEYMNRVGDIYFIV